MQGDPLLRTATFFWLFLTLSGEEAAQTIKIHRPGGVRWFTGKINSGILEGLNSLIQATKTKARGYRTFENFSAIVYLIAAKLDFSKTGLPIGDEKEPLSFPFCGSNAGF